MLKKIIQNNLSLVFFIAFVILVFFITLLLLHNYKKTEINKTNQLQFQELERLERFISSYNTVNLNKLKTAERIFFDMIQNLEPITINNNDSTYVDVIEKGISQKIKINRLYVNNKPLYLNNNIPERITYMTNAYVCIWQKIDKGYVRIASSKAGITQKEIPVLLGNSNQIITDIEYGKQHLVREYSDIDTELSSYKPIFIDGKIEAMLQISMPEFIPATIGKIYKKKDKRFFLLNKNEEGLIGNLTGVYDDNNLDELIKLILSVKDKNIKFKHKNNTVYVSFYPELHSYIGLLSADKDVLKNYYIYKKNLIYSFIILGILLSLGFILYYKISRKLKQINLLKFNNVFGNKVQNKKLLENDVLSDLKNYYSDMLIYIKNLSFGKTEFEINPGYDKDEISVFLKKLKKTINDNSIEKGKQIAESKLSDELNTGNVEITGLLQHVSNIEDLSFDILKSLTKFLGIQQGGLFIVNETNKKEPFLEMTASYAFDKKRLAEKTIKMQEGLVGRAYLERESIYITDVPEKYTSIESGFGEEEPKYLLIVPLIFNNQVQAVIELAGINEIEEYKIRFIEEAGENIASTISNLKHSKQTEELLIQTTIQSKEIEEQRQTLEEKINTHRRQNRKLDKEILQLIEIIESIKSVTYMIEYDLKGVVVDVSRKSLDLLNIKRGDIISSHHKDIVSVSNYERDYKLFWENLASNKPQTIKETFMIKDKEYMFVQNYVPIRNARRKIFRILSIGTIYN